MKREEFEKSLFKKFGDNISLLDKSEEIDTRQAANKIEFACKEHGKFYNVPIRVLKSKYGCTKCSRKKSRSLAKETMLDKYGADNPMKIKEFQDKAKKTNFKKYGADNPMKNEEVKNKLNETLIAKYGKEPWKNEKIIKKREKTNLEKLGVKYPSQSKEVIEKMKNTNLKKYGTEFIGSSKIIQNKREKTNLERYGVKNVFQSENVKEKIKQANLKKERSRQRKSSLLEPKKGFIPLTDGSATCTAIAKQYNFYEFYKTELEMWNKNENDVRNRIYKNRKKYLGKDEKELTDSEILSAFKIAGIYNTYSVYNNKSFKQVLDKYKIKSVIDYSSGWGERLLTCAARDIKYLGIDINPEVVKGHNNIIKDYNLTRQKSIVGDSSIIKIDNIEEFDMAFSCPPYYNLEKYTDKGADSLPSYKEFLDWWERLIKNVGKTKYFAFQMTTEFADDMVEIIENNKYNLIDVIECERRVSHLNNKSKYKEKVFIFGII